MITRRQPLLQLGLRLGQILLIVMAAAFLVRQLKQRTRVGIKARLLEVRPPCPS
jgi:flagellar biogenesis protein FliO